MTTITVYDPPMCCSTGVCGTQVDQKLVDLAADLDWLKAKGAPVRRINLSQEPAEFVANPTIAKLMQESDGDDLPAFMVDGKMVARARYPSRSELAEWAGVAAPVLEITEQVRTLIALGAAIGASCESCLKYHSTKARELGLSDAEMCEAIAVGQMVREASATGILALADKLIPAGAPASSGCCGNAESEQPAAASGCCGGGAKSAPETQTAGGCCG